VNYLEDLGEEVPKRSGGGAIGAKGKKKERKMPYTRSSRPNQIFVNN
jgi:hypothetical protein